MRLAVGALRVGAGLVGLLLLALPLWTAASVVATPFPLQMMAEGGTGGPSCRTADDGAFQCVDALSWAWLALYLCLAAGGALALYGALSRREGPLVAAAASALAAWSIFGVSSLAMMAGPTERWWQMLVFPTAVRGLLEVGALVALLALLLLTAAAGLRERAKV